MILVPIWKGDRPEPDVSRIARLAPGGAISSADLLTSIAKYLRRVSDRDFSRQPGQRARQLRAYAIRLDKLAKALEATP